LVCFSEIREAFAEMQTVYKGKSGKPKNPGVFTNVLTEKTIHAQNKQIHPLSGGQWAVF